LRLQPKKQVGRNNVGIALDRSTVNPVYGPQPKLETPMQQGDQSCMQKGTKKIHHFLGEKIRHKEGNSPLARAEKQSKDRESVQWQRFHDGFKISAKDLVRPTSPQQTSTIFV